MCLTTAFQEDWVSWHFLVVVSFGKIVWLSSCCLIYKRQRASAHSLLYGRARSNYTLCAQFEERRVRDTVFINYGLAFIACFMLFLRLYS